MRKIGIIVLMLLALPAFLHIYNPSMRLEGLGMLLGAIGITISPIILLAALIYAAIKMWGKDSPP